MGVSFAFDSKFDSNPGALPLNSGSPSPATAPLALACPRVASVLRLEMSSL